MAKKQIRVVAAVIERDGRYLLTQRKQSAVLPLLWEFPGGRVESDETDEQALVREVRWRIGVDAEIVERMGEHVHEYDDYDVHMTMFACRIAPDAVPEPQNVNAVRWVASADLSDYEFPPADQSSMDKLLGIDRWSPRS